MDTHKFSFQSLHVLGLAHQEARRLRRKSVGTEELLVALSFPSQSQAFRILSEFGVTVEVLQAALSESPRSVSTSHFDFEDSDSADFILMDSRSIPFSPTAEIALEKAIDLGVSGNVEPEQILFGLLCFASGAKDLLRALGIDLKNLDAAIFDLLNFKDANLFDSPFRRSSSDTGAPAPPRPAGSLKDKYRQPLRETDGPLWAGPEVAMKKRDKAVSGWFAPQAQVAMAKAFDQSVFLGHYYLGTEHVLFGLVSSGTKCTTNTFQYTKVNAASVNDQIKLLVPPPQQVQQKEMTMHTTAISLLEQSRAVMSQCGQELIECEHLLIAIIQSSNSLALTVLENLGVDPRVLKEVLLFWMEKYSAIPGSRSIIGRIDYARVKELNADHEPRKTSE